MDIDLLRKETYGMLYDRAFYEMIVNKIIDSFKTVFGDDMLLLNRYSSFEHMGYFKISYKYQPCDYDIIFENEKNIFTVEICDSEGAKTNLYRIQSYNNRLKIENIQEALLKLKTVLEENDMCFYVYKGDKLYKKKGKEYKRIKKLSEITGR